MSTGKIPIRLLQVPFQKEFVKDSLGEKTRKRSVANWIFRKLDCA